MAMRRIGPCALELLRVHHDSNHDAKPRRAAGLLMLRLIGIGYISEADGYSHLLGTFATHDDLSCSSADDHAALKSLQAKLEQCNHVAACDRPQTESRIVWTLIATWSICASPACRLCIERWRYDPWVMLLLSYMYLRDVDLHDDILRSGWRYRDCSKPSGKRLRSRQFVGSCPRVKTFQCDPSLCQSQPKLVLLRCAAPLA